MDTATEILDASHGALDRGDWARAAQGYLEVLAAQPENLEARAGLGTCVLGLEGTPEALARLGNPDRLSLAGEILRDLARALAYVGRRGEADRLLRGVGALSPGGAGAAGGNGR